MRGFTPGGACRRWDESRGRRELGRRRRIHPSRPRVMTRGGFFPSADRKVELTANGHGVVYRSPVPLLPERRRRATALALAVEKEGWAAVLLSLRLQEVAPLPRALANRLRFRHNVSLTVSVVVGTPPQNVTMVLDTGSELSWLLCNGSSVSPPAPFNASASLTYSAVDCSSPACVWRGRDLPVRPFCDAPPSTSCRVSLSYADASSADGHLVADTFILGTQAVPAPVRLHHLLFLQHRHQQPRH
ncbi:hypothetical protein ZWY2020_028361 [Hordeum vulgare]|nr:hypothetical protein ZWY2020_028361 [Hordeum vulgare]